MLFHRFHALIRSQRGVALPMALLTLLILSALIVAFSMMAASEPVLANNQLLVAQARAVAESGVERAIWALNRGFNDATDARGIPYPLVTPVAAPYNGTTAIPVMVNGVQVGVVTISVTQGTLANERNIIATGWTPTNTGTGPKVKQRIQVTVYQVGALDLPSPLTVRGEIGASGTARIDSRSDTDSRCGGAKPGSYSRDITNANGNAKIWGYDNGNSDYNQPGDIYQNKPDANFVPWTYSNTELNALKALAKANGTYYQGSPPNFNSSNKIKNGIVYVDTVSGNNIDAGPTPTDPTDFADVKISGDAPMDPSNIFSGMLVVAGKLTIDGSFQMHGMVYVLNDFIYTGTGAGQITGAVMSQNVRDVSATTIDTDTGGNSTIIWNCGYAKTGGGQLPGFIIEAGTYKEVSG